MIKKIAIGLVIVFAVFWVFRAEVTLFAAHHLINAARDVGPNRSVAWERGPEVAAVPPSERPPNIVLILADDMGWNDVSTHGGGAGAGTVKTPNIDSIARDGVDFVNGYSANGTCAPSRAAILSGRYGTRFGFEFTPTPAMMSPLMRVVISAQGGDRRGPVQNPDAERIPFEDMGMPASEVTIAETLQAAGYHTVHIGKWHVGDTNGMAAFDQGFDESLAMGGMLFMPEDHPDVVNSKQEFDPIDRFLWTAGGYGVRYNDGPVVRAQGTRHRLLHRRSGEGDRGQQASAVLPLSGALGRAHTAPVHQGGLRGVPGHREPHRAHPRRDDPRARSQRRSRDGGASRERARGRTPS